MALEDTLEERNLELEESSRTCKKYKYVVVTIISVGTCELEINDKICEERAAISKWNIVLWDGNMTFKTYSRIDHSIIKSRIINLTVSWCLK